MTMENMDSFGINSTKSCGIYLDIQTILNQKYLNYKVVDVIEYYNFDIKFIFVEHHMKKLWSFFAAYHCWFKTRSGRDSTNVSFRQKPAVMAQYHY